MSDDSVRAALRSDAKLVVVEAPAGCGKTHQGADYARALALEGDLSRLLILTHTHAACSVFSDRTSGLGSRIEIRTIDSVIAQIAHAYHVGLGLPEDTSAWVRQHEDGHASIALKVAKLMRRHPMIPHSVAQRYQTIICDEHQDSSGDQHAVVMALLDRGANVRIFGDPMQKIFRNKGPKGGNPACDWKTLAGQAELFDELDTPHRWTSGCPVLGQWTLSARKALKSGGAIDLRGGLPPSVTVVRAENQAKKNFEYQLADKSRRPIDAFVKAQDSLLILTCYNTTSRSLRAFFNRRIPLWEGHTRPGLDKLVSSVNASEGDCASIAGAVVAFMARVGKGFSRSAFGDAFQREASEGCATQRRGKPAKIQELARFLVTQPDHRGVAKMLNRLYELAKTDAAFGDIELDCNREFWDAVQLGKFDSINSGLAEITHRRTYSRPKPPDRAISTIHKAKGLECGSVVLMPIDAATFPDRPDARCLLYVALSRATTKLLLTVSEDKPSPLLVI